MYRVMVGLASDQLQDKFPELHKVVTRINSDPVTRICCKDCLHLQGENGMNINAKGSDPQLVSNLLDEIKAIV